MQYTEQSLGIVTKFVFLLTRRFHRGLLHDVATVVSTGKIRGAAAMAGDAVVRKSLAVLLVALLSLGGTLLVASQ